MSADVVLMSSRWVAEHLTTLVVALEWRSTRADRGQISSDAAWATD